MKKLFFSETTQKKRGERKEKERKREMKEDLKEKVNQIPNI